MTERTCIIDVGYIIGGDEGHLLVEKLVCMFVAWADQRGYRHEVLGKAPAFGGGLKWAKLKVECDDCGTLCELHQGVHTMVRTPPDSSHRHMSAAGVRVSEQANLPLPTDMASWGDERRRYVFDPYRAMNDAKLGRLEIDPDLVFAGDFSRLAKF